MDRRRAVRSLGALTLVAVACSVLGACQSSSASSSGSGAAATTKPAPQFGISSPAQLPDPCKLVAPASVFSALGAKASPTAGAPLTDEGRTLLIRTCTWGDINGPNGAVGIQVGVPDATGHDVVANRTRALDPALNTAIGDDGKETMNVGEMPTGGARGSTIFFHHIGYSVMIGHVGTGANMASVETLGKEAIAKLDALAPRTP